MDFISQRSFEIAFAAFRVAELFKRSYLRDAVEIAATDFYAKNKKDALERLERLIRIAEAIGEVSAVNAAVLYREIGNIQSVSLLEISRRETIRQSQNEMRQVEIESIFSKPPMVIETSDKRQATSDKQQETSNGILAHENGNGINAAMRQSAIIEKIRQSGKGSPYGRSPAGRQMRDLIAAFPDVSERTLRYDLQKLCDNGVIERVGNSGPASYYRLISIRSNTPTPIGN